MPLVQFVFCRLNCLFNLRCFLLEANNSVFKSDVCSFIDLRALVLSLSTLVNCAVAIFSSGLDFVAEGAEFTAMFSFNLTISSVNLSSCLTV